jgi:hypothetical protein
MKKRFFQKLNELIELQFFAGWQAVKFEDCSHYLRVLAQ